MTAIAKDQLKPYALGHLGLAGAFIRECGLIDKIDSLIPKDSFKSWHDVDHIFYFITII